MKCESAITYYILLLTKYCLSLTVRTSTRVYSMIPRPIRRLTELLHALLSILTGLSSESSRQSSLFMPSSQEDAHSLHHLFAACPSETQIQVSSLKRQRSEYCPFSTSHSTVVNKRRVPTPSTLQEATLTSPEHNGALSWDNLEKKNTKERQEENVVAGPSGTTIRVSRPRTKKRLKHLWMTIRIGVHHQDLKNGLVLFRL